MSVEFKALKTIKWPTDRPLLIPQFINLIEDEVYTFPAEIIDSPGFCSLLRNGMIEAVVSPEGTGCSVIQAIFMIVNINSTDSPYDILPNDYTVVCDAQVNSVEVRLPAAVDNEGRIVNIKRVDTGGIDVANFVDIVPDGADLIDGNNLISLTAQYEGIAMQSDGLTWHKIFAV